MRPSPFLTALARWFDAGTTDPDTPLEDRRIDWLRVVPFIALHLGCLAVFWTGASLTAVVLCLGLYLVRMFAITGFYHRYFAHRAFRTSRPVQFLFALLGATAVQRGPLWWGAHHRHHHRHTDTALDLHSPGHQGFLRAHVGWFLTRGAFRTRLEEVPDLARYPELRFLDRFDTLVPLALLGGLWLLGEHLAVSAPGLGTSGAQLVAWGFCVSTVALYHATFLVNSAAHLWGVQPWETGDDSRNCWWVALLTLGEGWHNNHHRFPGAARQGLRWWEPDPTWWGLSLLAAVGLIWDLKPAPQAGQRA